MKALKSFIFKRKLRLILLCLFIGLYIINFSNSYAAVTITTASGSICAGAGYATLADINIAEFQKCDFPSGQSSLTYILDIPSGFEFNSGVGSLSCSGGDLTCVSISVTTTTITITLTTDNNCNGGNGSKDNFTISGIEFKANSAGSGDITFSASSTFNASGVSTGTVHGTLTGTGGSGATTVIASGNWSSTSTWSGGSVPTSCDSVEITAGFTVTVDGASSCKSIVVENGSTLNGDAALTISGYFVLNSGGTYNHNNSSAASTTIFNGTESFDANSTIIVSEWGSWSTPFPTGVSGNFGNVTFLSTESTPFIYEWNQNNLFETNQILGTFILGSTANGTGAYIVLDKSGSISNTTFGNIVMEDISRLYGHSGTHGGSFTVNIDTLTMGGFRFYGQYNGSGNVTLNITGDCDVSSGIFYGIYSGSGNSTITITGNLTISGTTQFYGIYNGNGNSALTVTGNMTITTSSNVYGIYFGTGSSDITVGGILNQTSGDFRGSYYNTLSACGAVTMNIGEIDFDGGTFMVSYSRHANVTITLNVTNDFNINFGSSSDYIKFVGLGVVSGVTTTANVDFDVGGNMIISGNASALFKPNVGYGDTDVDIVGDLRVSGGNNRFNWSDIATATHNVTFDVTDSLVVSGGTFLFSEKDDSLTASFGSVEISGGTTTLKGRDGIGTVNVVGSFEQSGGTFYMHNNSSNATSDIVSMTVNGDFTHSAGTLNFDNNSSSTSTHVITLKGSNYAIGSSGTMTRAGAGTSSTFGELNFNKTGAMRFTRTSGHDIQQVKQYVKGGCTLLVASGDIQVASHSTVGTDYFSIENTAVVIMDTNQIYSNGTATNSGMEVLSGAEIRTMNVNGFHGSTTSCVKSSNNMDFSLDANSIVEYYGVDNQILTGLTGSYTSTQHKYGILEINFAGAANTEYVYPTSSNVYIRTLLDLQTGELNLDTDHTPGNGGGSTVTVEKDATTAVTRTSGYLRSEVEDNTGILNWYIGSQTGSFVFPFGYDNTNYIPLTFNVSAGSADSMKVATYGVECENTPFPSSPNSVSDVDVDGDAVNDDTTTVNRFYQLDPTGSPTATITFKATSTEVGSISGIKTYRWNTSTTKWDSIGGTSASDGATVSAVSTYSDWLLASGKGGLCTPPLNVEIISFKLTKTDDIVQLDWTTVSEVASDYFTVEKSLNGVDFEPIAIVEAQGYSIEQQDYVAFDYSPAFGANYYRLKETNLAGEVWYTEVLGVYFKYDEGLSLSKIYPVPAGRRLNLTFASSQSQVVSVSVYDLIGEKLYEGSTIAGIGLNEVHLNISELLPGFYLVTLQDSTGEIVQSKFIKL